MNIQAYDWLLYQPKRRESIFSALEKHGALSKFTADQERACTGANAGIKKKMLAVISVPT